MTLFSELARHLEVLRDAFGDDVEAVALPSALERLDDDAVVEALTAATGLVRVGEKVRIAAAGVASARSARDLGHDGLAQKRGHRSPEALIQEITGGTRADAVKHVRLGESLRTAAGLASHTDADPDAATPAEAEDPVRVDAWHAPLGRALLEGIISSAQHDAILRGLGDPPTPGATDETILDTIAAADVAGAWSVAAEHLIAEARERTVEELGRAARSVRDQLDPDGAQRRFDERFEARAFRLWRDGDGIRRGSIVFDDHGGAWAQTILDSALRPRRGGPRFVDPDEKSRADELAADTRTNDQLAYDLLLDVLRAGALADAEAVFGTRQAGVRVVITADALDAAGMDQPAVGMVEDDQSSLPAWLIQQQSCESGAVTCTIDAGGAPLDVGREQRLFTPKQRMALAARDGGCRWRGCDRPASYCEAHHIDPYAHGGRTDIDRGILLCRWHHMELHHGGWRITREGRGDFVLHPPSGRREPVTLPARLALRYAWTDLERPPKRFRPVA
jgi:hypothetical protein